MSGLCVFCCLRSIDRRTVVVRCIMWTIVCVLLSKVYIQANMCGKLHYVANYDTGVIRTYSSYLCEYINWAFLFLYNETGLKGTITKLQIL